MKNSLLKISLLFLSLPVCTFAQQEQATFSFIKPIKLGEAINSSCDETAPVLSSKGNRIYFTRVMCAQNTGGESAGQDIWYSELDANGNWKTATRLMPPLNNIFENSAISLTDNNTKLYLANIYRGTEKMAPGISFSTLKADSTWDTPKSIHLKGFVFKKNTFTSFHVSSNDKHLFISRFRKDSADAEDLFISHKDASGRWSDPINIGTDVNTDGFETSPFLSDDDSTLYFSSNGWGGYGDADIFMTKRLDDTWKKWSKPVNLGNVVNSKGFDGYFTPTANGNAYFVSGDSPTALGDIYLTKKMRPFNYLNISVVSSKTGKPLESCTVTSTIKETKELYSKTTLANGSGQIKISPTPQKYFFVVQAEGFIATDQPFEISQMMINKDTSLTFSISPLEVGQTVQLNNIFFETGKSTLLEDSFDELNVLLELLQQNATMEILITGHTDNKGLPKANQLLSESRVKSVDEYLVSKGIDTKRLKYKGLGSSKPISDNKTEEGRAKNRRVEFQILKK